LLRIHFLQQWFGLSDPAMEESLHGTSLHCEFARLDPRATRVPDESTIKRFRHLLEADNQSRQIMVAINATLTKRCMLLKTGRVVDATLIAGTSSTENRSRESDPEMQQTEKGQSMALRNEGSYQGGC
jgi:IS5 family transposase